MSYANEVKSACGFDTSRPVILAGNGPTILSLDYRQLPVNPYIFRCNWFFMEDHYRLGRRVDGYFWSVHNEGMLRGLEEASRIGGYEVGAYFSPTVFKEFGDSESLCSKLTFTPAHNHWRVIAEKAELAASMMMRPLPTQGMQMLATALQLGFKEIYLIGIDFYQDSVSRYAYQVPLAVSEAWLVAKDLAPGYDSAHDISVDLRMLQFSLNTYPEAKIVNLSCDNPLLPKFKALTGGADIWFEGKDHAEFATVTPSKRRLYHEQDFEGNPAKLKCAFVTYLSGKFVHGVAALANSLAKVSRIPLIVMVPPGTDTSLFPKIENIRIFFVEEIGNPDKSRHRSPCPDNAFSKLNVFKLDFLDRAVFITPDALVLKNIDQLFCHAAFAAVPDLGSSKNPGDFNSGVFACSPSAELFADVLKKLSKVGRLDGGFQGFLNSYFDHAERLDPGFNTPHQISREFPEIFSLEEISVLNFGSGESSRFFEPGKEANYKFLISLWFSHLPDQSKIALLHEFRGALTGESAFNVRVSHQHFEIDGVLPATIQELQPLVIKPIEMAQALLALGRHDLARIISTACLQKSPGSKSHQAIIQECNRLPAGSATTKGMSE